jgi:hypothetical protein
MGTVTSGGKRFAKVLSPVLPLCASIESGVKSIVAKNIYLKNGTTFNELNN